MAPKTRDSTKQWNCKVRCVPHVPFTRMTPIVSKGNDPYAYTYGTHGLHSA